MKTINVREAREKLSDLLDEAQEQPIIITRHGKPAVLITGIDGVDLGSFVLEGSPEFWAEIERRRKSARPRRTQAQLREKYGLPAGRAKKAG